MQAEQLLIFGSYHLDPHTGQLWRGKQEVTLTPKVSALLRFLIERVGQVVSKEELFQAVWPETVVSDAALTTCVQEVRQALHDNAKKPRYIETVHRRGYRWLAPLRTASPVQSSKFKVQSSPAPNTQHPASVLVGRETDLTQLHAWLANALTGERQLVFITGEPGIGKTTLIEIFVSEVREHQKVVRSQHSVVSREEKESQNSKGKTQKPALSVVEGSKLTDPRPLTPAPQIGRGQCIEHYGVGEAYLPILEALGRLCREPGSERLIALLKQHAPTWVVQMPALLNPEEIEGLQRKTAGATRERMLRELAEALEVMTAERPLVLVLEDLHWSDVSTLDLLSMLARRQERAHLMIIGTYRPVEVLTRDHPLKGIKQELQLHGHCQELALDFLREDHVAEYLARRTKTEIETERKQDRLLAAVPSPQETIGMPQLARIIHRRTDGNPLFMVNLIDHLLSQGVLVQAGAQWRLKHEDLAATVPENLRQLIEQQLARVNPEQRRILEAASVAGAEFSAAAVAAGVETTVEAVEEQCEELARREQFLRTQGTSEWPDGMVAARYGFVHALYQEVIYARLTARRQQRLHQQIGEREEQGYGERAKEIAAELAVHFERGRDYRKAVQYLQYAGENASQRNAYVAAVGLLTKGLGLLNTLTDTPERSRQELRLQLALAPPLIATKSYTAPEVESVYTRALELCQQVEQTPELFWVLLGLRTFHLLRAELKTARELAEQCLELAQNVHNPSFLVWAHFMLGQTLFRLGEFALAREHLETGIALYDPQQHRSYGTLPEDPGVDCLCYATWNLWFLGYPDQALQRSHAALTLAQELSQPYSLALALDYAARLHQHRREVQAVQEQAEALIALSTEQGFPLCLAYGTTWRGWALVEQGEVEEGITQIRQGLETWQATGAEMGRPYFLALLAEAYGKAGRVKEGLTLLAEALAFVDKTGERMYEAELYRIKGELALQQFKVQGSKFKVENSLGSSVQSLESEAEGCFLKAIDIARRQQAKSLELRAVMSLVRLRQHQARDHATRHTQYESRNTQHETHVRLAEAHKMLSEIYNWFTEGFDTKDLQEAKALLEELRLRAIEPLKD